MKLRIAILVFGLIIISIGDVYGADWKLYEYNEKFLAYYDAQSITRLSKNIVRIWLKRNYTEKGVMYMVGNLGKKYENLSYSIILNEINCIEKMFRLKSRIDYDNKGGVIYSSSFPLEWNFIIPGSIGETLYEEICK
jgi:hypothetical protein